MRVAKPVFSYIHLLEVLREAVRCSYDVNQGHVSTTCRQKVSPKNILKVLE